MHEIWRIISGFESYEISNLGQVRNRNTGRIRMTSRSVRYGAKSIMLRKDGEEHGLSVKLLVAEAFLPRSHWYEMDPDVFDSVIQLNWDQNDCRVENLMWRPRWFVWHYTRQRLRQADVHYLTPVINISTGVYYHTMVEAAQTEGLLMRGIYNSAGVGEAIFPTGDHFQHVK